MLLIISGNQTVYQTSTFIVRNYQMLLLGKIFCMARLVQLSCYCSWPTKFIITVKGFQSLKSSSSSSSNPSTPLSFTTRIVTNLRSSFYSSPLLSSICTSISDLCPSPVPSKCLFILTALFQNQSLTPCLLLSLLSIQVLHQALYLFLISR